MNKYEKNIRKGLYIVLEEILIGIKKKRNLIYLYIYKRFRNKRIYIYKKEGGPYSSVGRASD